MKTLTRRQFIKTAAAGIPVAAAGSRLFAGQKSARRPNIIVVFTDDQGFADLRVQGQVDDVKTPNIDKLAETGVRMTAGYVSAPQCAPSRAGLMSGKYQQRFGFDHNGATPFPLDETMIARRMKDAGYVTGMAGKWHLGFPHQIERQWPEKHYPDGLNRIKQAGRTGTYWTNRIPQEMKLPFMTTERGFDYAYEGKKGRYWANYTLQGERIEKQYITNEDYRLDVQTQAAVAFIEQNHNKPFFFYLPYFGPHPPLEATEKYLKRFPGKMDERRRLVLAMLSAIDDGVGKIKETLRKHRIEDNTMIVFISDNGGLLAKGRPEVWAGSLNDPYIGDKGMLAEGGIRVPFIMNWPKGLPKGRVYKRPVISLDIAATSLAMAGEKIPEELDGVNILPYVRGETKGDPHKTLYWRFFNQTAIRQGDWKYLHFENREFLFNVETDEHEHKNLIGEHPELAEAMKKKLVQWASELKKPGLRILPRARAVRGYNFYFPTRK